MRGLLPEEEQALIQILNLRASPRRDAALHVVALCKARGWLTRGEILDELATTFYWKCLDRAVDALLACRLIEVVDGVALTQGGGRKFRLRAAAGVMDPDSIDQSVGEEVFECHADPGLGEVYLGVTDQEAAIEWDIDICG